MPQMSPMFWAILFTLFLMYTMFLKSILYPPLSQILSINMKNKNKKKNLKW